MAAERAGEEVPELHIAPPQNGCWQLWETFIELHNARGAGMGPSPITWRDLSAWQEVRGVVLTPWEVDTVMALDQVAMKSMNEKKP